MPSDQERPPELGSKEGPFAKLFTGQEQSPKALLLQMLSDLEQFLELGF